MTLTRVLGTDGVALLYRIGPHPRETQAAMAVDGRKNSEPVAGASERVLVSLATYKERENLEALIHEIHTFAPHADVLVVDDNSPDGTGELADRLAAADPRIHVLHRSGKLGL